MFVKSVEDALSFITKEVESLRSKADDSLPKIKKLDAYPDLGHLFSYQLDSVSNSGSYWRYTYEPKYTRETAQVRMQSLLLICTNLRESLEPVRQKNQEIVEHNKTVVAKIKEVMSFVGFPDSIRVQDTKSRARQPKYITQTAGYLQDIQKHVPTVDHNYTSLINKISAKETQIKKWHDSIVKEINESERIVTAERLKVKQAQFLAAMSVKYNLPFDLELGDVTEALLDKCKYLKLSSAMEDARLFFQRGDLVSHALDTFKIESDEDQQIYDAVEAAVNHWNEDGDGRVFRDCEWNYSELSRKVDSNLMEDWTNLNELFSCL